MAKSLYTAQAHVTGGREQGHGVTSDGALDVQLRTPTEMGGAGGGTNPEQLFAVGYAACFEGALGVVGRREKVELGEVAIDSEVGLSPPRTAGSTSPSRSTWPSLASPKPSKPLRSWPRRTRCARTPTPPAATWR